MNIARTSRPAATSRPLVRWIFSQGALRLTCGVVPDTNGGYALVVMPGTGQAGRRVVSYQSALDALRQHAAVAAALRDLGWTVTQYTSTRGPDPASAKSIAA